MTVGQVAAVSEVHEHRIAGLSRPAHDMFACAPNWLNVHVLGGNSVSRAHGGASATSTNRSRRSNGGPDSLRVFAGQDRSGRLEHGAAHEIFRGDQPRPSFCRLIPVGSPGQSRVGLSSAATWREVRCR